MTRTCNQCGYQATSARQLSRHKAVTHVKNPLSCILCPFVTAYQTNLLRHRKEVHGILGSKGKKSCKFCGFEANDNITIISHQQEAHQDILKSARERFAREKKSARGTSILINNSNENSNDNTNFNENLNNGTLNLSNGNANTRSQNMFLDFNNSINNTVKKPQLFNNQDLSNQSSNDEDDKDFWKEGFIDNPPSLLNYDFNNFILSNEQEKLKIDENLYSQVNNNNQDLNNISYANAYSPTSVYASDYTPSRPESPVIENNSNITTQDLSPNSTAKSLNNKLDLSNQLAPTRIRRQYTCSDCGFRTVNPREFLYHRRDIHNQKVKIVECPYCVYACQYFQKLQRHMLLVHKLETSMTPPIDNQASSNGKQNLTTNTLNKTTPLIKPMNYSAKNSNEDDQSNEENDEENKLNEEKIYNSNKSSSPSKKQSLKGVNYVKKPEEKSFTKHVVSMKRCKYCPFQTDSFSKLEKHENSFHPEKRYQCPLCEIRFENLVWLQRHLLHMHQNDGQTSQIVNILEMVTPKRKRVKPNNNLNNNNGINNSNSNNIHNEQSNNNNENNDFNSTSNVNNFITPTIDKGSTKCSICGYQTRWFSELQKHLRVHTNEKPFRCISCSFKTKWKGDLNRHIQKYHLNSTLECENNENNSSPDQQFSDDDGDRFDENLHDSNENENCNYSLHGQDDLDYCNENDDLDEPSYSNSNLNDQVYNSIPIDQNLGIDAETQNSSNLIRNQNETKVKVYKCTYCNFDCPTPSRFHVHFVQHLKTKPFMCSVCKRRSNWEWDVNKHIKKKCEEEGGDHANATTVLVHDSGKRDYRKYDKYLILVNKPKTSSNDQTNEINASNYLEFNKLDISDNNDVLLSNEQKFSKSEDYGIDMSDQLDVKYSNDAYDPESIIITPDINFSIGSEAIDLNKSINNVNSDKLNLPKNSFYDQNLPLYNNLSSLANESNNSLKTMPSNTSVKQSKLFYCAYCNYTHRDSKSLVSHLSIHAKKKPFRCRKCGFSSNWREVLNRHVASRHSGTSVDIEQLFKYTVSKYICRIIDEKGQINPGPETTTQADIKQPMSVVTNGSFVNQNNTYNSSVLNDHKQQQQTNFLQQQNLHMMNSMLAQQLNFMSTNQEPNKKTYETPEVLAKHGISGRISGFKGEFKCSLCPFRAEKAFHMDFHSKRHNQMPGADFKCPHCPYWVNAKKSLVKHVYLHKYENEIEDTLENQQSDLANEENDSDSDSKE